MTVQSSLESTARELLAHEWKKRSHGDDAPHNAENTAGECPMFCVLPDLIDLIAEHHHQPVRCLAPLIGRLVQGHGETDDHAAAVLGQMFEDTQRQVDILVDVLEQVRQEALRDGEPWPDAPVTPMMFG